MLRFFRHIRKKLMEQHKARSYFLYALGEIILVMIGILLALQVNNWNEQRKSEDRFVSILKEMQTDIITDVKAINGFQPFGFEIDSLAGKILAGEISRSEYEDPDNHDLFWIGLQYIPFAQQTNAFNKFKSFDEKIEPEYDELVNQINDFYIETSELIRHRQDIFIATIEERHDYMSKNYGWYYLLRQGTYNEEMLDYYLNDPEYKNFVSRYRPDQLFGPLGYLASFKNAAILVYFMINDALGETEIDELFREIDQNHFDDDVASLIGTYKRDDSNIIYELKLQKGLLFFTYLNESRRLILIKKDSVYSFLNQPNSRVLFHRDSTNTVTSMSWVAEPDQIIIFNRIQ